LVTGGAGLASHVRASGILAVVSHQEELARAAIDAWNREDISAWLEAQHPDVAFHTSGVFPGHDAVYRGHEELARFWRIMHEPWETLRLDLQRYAEGPDVTVVEFRFRATGAGSGADVDMTFCNASRLQDGLFAEVWAVPSFEEACRLVGLSAAG
jgi:ketosteroid isomerase-like protein